MWLPLWGRFWAAKCAVPVCRVRPFEMSSRGRLQQLPGHRYRVPAASHYRISMRQKGLPFFIEARYCRFSEAPGLLANGPPSVRCYPQQSGRVEPQTRLEGLAPIERQHRRRIDGYVD
jgi:hypothetical protein